MNLGRYLEKLHRAQTDLAGAFGTIAAHHRAEIGIASMCDRLAVQCRRHAGGVAPYMERYGEHVTDAVDAFHTDIFGGPRSGPLGLLRDLHDLYLMASDCDIAWTLIGQGAQGARDSGLLALVHDCEGETAAQLAWIASRMKEAAPQTLVVA